MSSKNNKLSVPSAIFIGIGAMIGSAIFSLSGLTIMNAGSGALLSWSFAGIILLAYGYIAVVLARKFPQTGGMYFFPSLALKSLFDGTKSDSRSKNIGFLSSWCYFFGCFCGVIFAAIYIGYYFGYLFPSLVNYTSIVSVISVLIAVAINLPKFKMTGRINIALVSVLLLVLILYCVLVLIYGSKTHIIDFTYIFSEFNLSKSLTSIPVAMLAYGSIVVPAFMISNIKNGDKVVGKVTVISLIVTMSVYLIVIFFTLMFVQSTDLIQSPDMSYSPFIFALIKVSAPSYFMSIVNIGAILALFTTEFVVLRLAAISLQSASYEGSFFKSFANEKFSIVIVGLLCAVLSYFSQFSSLIIDLGALANVLFIILICVSGFVVLNDGVSSKSEYSSVLPNVLSSRNVLKVISILVPIVLIICYIPDFLKGGAQLWIVTTVYLIFGFTLKFISRQK